MTKWNHSVQAQSASVWLLFVIASLWLAVSLSWWVYARFDYGYSFWYDQLAIGAHIQRYVPKHPDKADFAQLPKEQHVEAFRQIRLAVHDGGTGLAQIRYPGAKGDKALLDAAEVQHLRDVAHLLDRAALAFWPVLVLWAGLAWYLGRRPLPPWRFRAAALAGLAMLVLVTFAVVGAKQIFYTLHVWLFPPENQWFFYWELSLMSAMMKAPYLFGGIAAVLATAGGLLAFFLYSGALKGVQRLGARS
jgi:hypothetical protein